MLGGGGQACVCRSRSLKAVVLVAVVVAHQPDLQVSYSILIQNNNNSVWNRYAMSLDSIPEPMHHQPELGAHARYLPFAPETSLCWQHKALANKGVVQYRRDHSLDGEAPQGQVAQDTR